MKKFIILLSAALFVFSSCNFLDRYPKDKQVPENYFQTETQLQLFSNNFYSNQFSTDFFQNQNDLIFQTASLANELKGGTNRQVPASGGGWSWGILRKINTMLDHIDQCNDESAREQYTAVARFFRAHFYFEKVKRFGDVPWYEHELASDSPELYKPRDSREMVIDKVLEDLDYAAEHLTANVTTYRVNKWAALALKSRVCLFEGTWRKYHTEDTAEYTHEPSYYLELAATAAKAVMDGGKYSIDKSTTKPYLDMFKAINASTKEYILAIHFDPILEVCHARTFNAFQMGGQTISRKAVNMYLKKDGTRFTDQTGYENLQFAEQVADRDPRLAQTIVTPGYERKGIKSSIYYPLFRHAKSGYQSVKFVMDLNDDTKNDQVISDGKSYNDLPVIRYAEVLLNYAEALAELGTLTQEDINKSIKLLRDRVGMPNLNMDAANGNPCAYLSSAEYGYRNVTGANKGVILEIRRERTVELMQEGKFRWEDLMRWKEGPCVDQEMLGMYFPGPGEYDLNADGTPDHCLYEGVLPTTTCEITMKIGDDIILSEGNKGFVVPHTYEHHFDEERDYLYPIPYNEISLTGGALKQNPGWN